MKFYVYVFNSQISMSAVLLPHHVTSMPTAAIMSDLMFVPVKRDLLEMGKAAHVCVSSTHHQNTITIGTN